jgi:hypothetical protein
VGAGGSFVVYSFAAGLADFFVALLSSKWSLLNEDWLLSDDRLLEDEELLADESLD